MALFNIRKSVHEAFQIMTKMITLSFSSDDVKGRPQCDKGDHDQRLFTL